MSWGHAAIGNAEWTGVKLSDLLKKLGVNESSKALHVQVKFIIINQIFFTF